MKALSFTRGRQTKTQLRLRKGKFAVRSGGESIIEKERAVPWIFFSTGKLRHKEENQVYRGRANRYTRFVSKSTKQPEPGRARRAAIRLKIRPKK